VRCYVVRRNSWRERGDGARCCVVECVKAGCWPQPAYALDHNVERLDIDHKNAARLASGLARFKDLKVRATSTNMVFLDAGGRLIQELTDWLKVRNILVCGRNGLRLVTHLDINASDVDLVIDVVAQYFDSCCTSGSA
jgi:threonine aldolase